MITSRIDAITRIPQEYRREVCPAPRSVKIELTARCNYRCRFCVKAIRPDNTEMHRGFFSRIIREMRACGVEELGVFYIGESFLCDWLPQAIEEAKGIGFPYVFLTTNGSIATPERVESCMRAGLDSLKFSLNFSDAGQFEEVTGTRPENYARAMANLKSARRIRDRAGYRCGLYASSIAFDGQQGERMRSIVAEALPHVDEHYWLPLYGMGGAAEAAGFKPRPGNPGRLDAMRPPLPCWACFTEGHVTARGELVACCFGTGAEGALVMGDLKRHGFMEAWNGEAFRSLRRAHLALDVAGTGCAECAAGAA